MIIRDLIRAFMPKALDTAQITSSSYWTPASGNMRMTKSGQLVGPEQAMALPAYYAAMRAISEDYAKIPVSVYRVDGNRKDVEAENEVARVLQNPNQSMTGFVFRELIQSHAIGWGNGIALIVESKIGTQLWPIYPWEVEIKYSTSDKRAYYAARVNGKRELYDAESVIHIHGLGSDGIQGYSAATILAESIGLSLAVQSTGANFFKHGAMLSGILRHPGRISDKTRAQIKESWAAQYSGSEGTGGTPFLEEGVIFEKLAIPPEDAQFLQTKEAGIEDVCRTLRIQPHKIHHLARATFSNIEHQSIEYVVDTLMPWVMRWEQEIERKFFGDDQTLRVEHDLKSLLRGDQAARAQFFKEMWMIGAITRNEIRQDLNLPPVDGGDVFYTPMNMRAETGEEDAEEPADEQPIAPLDEEAEPSEEEQEEDDDQEDPEGVAALASMRDAMSVLFDDAAARVKDREAKAATRAAKNVGEFDQWSADFYIDNDSKIVESFAAPVAVASTWVKRKADLSKFAREYNDATRDHLRSLVREKRIDAIAPFLSSDATILSKSVQNLCWERSNAHA